MQNTTYQYLTNTGKDFMSVLRISFYVFALGCLGCAAEQESLHEHDHEVPPHWPTNMLNAAELIKERVDRLTQGEAVAASESQGAEKELLDLVEWSPEIAADTDLSEEDWIPIYTASEGIRKNMMSATGFDDALASDLEELILLLQNAHESLGIETTGA